MADPIRTTCPYCGVGCGILVTADGKIVGDPEHPANRGRLCSKGAALGETLGDGDRLLYPQIRGERASWDAALDLVAATFGHVIAADGPDAVAFYVSGQFLTEDYYVANKLMKGFIGSGNIDTNSRLCMASTVAGHVRAFGEDVVPGCYEDVEAADLVVLVGSNMAWCHPVLYQRLVAAREKRGVKIVVIDPRRTATCENADLHLALQPGSDVALFAGLLLHLAKSGVAKPGFAAGFADVVETARRSAGLLDRVAAVTDLPLADIARFYDWFSATERTVTTFSQGVNQSSAGTDKVNAIINCHLATGRIGRPGMGPLSLTGQPNAMGGREVGGLANQLATHLGFTDAAIDGVRRFWDAPRIATRPGLKAVDLFDAVLDGRVKALWILGSNPADSMPRAGRVREALAACPFVVVSDCWPTDTTALADIVLPAAGWSEKDGTVTNSERCISRQRAFRPPPGEARPDWWMLSRVAHRLGWGRAFHYAGPADIFREHAALSAFENTGMNRRLFDIGAFADLTDDAYDRLSPIQWPVRGDAGGVAGTARLRDADRCFPTEDGRGRLVATPYRAVARPVSPEWPLVLNTGRVRDQWHTMTRTGRVPRLATHSAEPFLDVHSDDAERLHLRTGSLAAVESPHGKMVLPVRVSSSQRRGEVFVPMHWTDHFSSAGPIDRLVGAAVDPVSGQPELKATPVRVAPVAPLWSGLLLRRTEAAPVSSFYWARIPIEQGHAYELRGWEPLPSGRGTEKWVAALLGSPEQAEQIIYADPAQGIFRYASLIDARLDSCLFFARNTAALPSRDIFAAMLGVEVEVGKRLGLLAGRTGSDMSLGDAGRMVCACFGVGVRTLHRAIADRKLSSVAEIGAALRAGTNCGSCVPELAAMLRRG
ncbi:MAG TPA: molybdopterin-dependent oxidoreductase [Stellaceae bacterium]|jgi:assimilatory nitrate reductase catalytic subunit|nr:molybdopterin-dependent oxidoreductase [Stellaceae bacterium]